VRFEVWVLLKRRGFLCVEKLALPPPCNVSVSKTLHSYPFLRQNSDLQPTLDFPLYPNEVRLAISGADFSPR